MPPKYLYKILDEAPAEPLPETLPSTPLDIQDGFIHLSTDQQTPITATLFFAGHTRLWVLRLDREALNGRISYSTDPKAGIVDGCAHVHESQAGLGRRNVTDVIELRRRDGEKWTDVVGMRELGSGRN